MAAITSQMSSMLEAIKYLISDDGETNRFFSNRDDNVIELSSKDGIDEA